VNASELAFLALGLLLGAAAGAALIVVLSSRPPRREIKVTVTRDAVPRRSTTLSSDAFVTSPGEPARGGPGDRRTVDRDEGRTWFSTAPTTGLAPRGGPPGGPPGPAPDRTAVPSRPDRVGIAIHPEPDPGLEVLRTYPAGGPALMRILRGDHRAMLELVDSMAGHESQLRREWELLLSGLADGLRKVAVEEGAIDFPLGTAFWDTFTVEQCRAITLALASMGFHYDGHDGWLEGRVPAYRDLAQALADVGVEPRRVRAWPNQAEIGALFVGARPAADEMVAATAPTLDAAHIRELLGSRADGLAGLWLAWESVRPMLLAEGRTTSS
jgi:hypothetical protein